MPKPKTPRKSRPLYRTKSSSSSSLSFSSSTSVPSIAPSLEHSIPAATSPFTLHDDGSITPLASDGGAVLPRRPDFSSPSPPRSGEEGRGEVAPSSLPVLAFSDPVAGIYLYHGNCLDLLDKIAEKYPEGRFDCIFADPPYFLSNGGITCHAGKMVKVDKGGWDKSQGPELNHEFNRAWLERCQRVLKPNGSIWVTGTHHVIFSIGFAMQQLGFKILNDITWEKPNPPPNLSCRYFTHSTETIIWAAKNEKSKHTFNYAAMKAITGKQMKTVWTMTSPKNGEKAFGKHPTQKPVALVERCILASTNPRDLVLDPFMGAATTALACLHLERQFIGIELDPGHFTLARHRTDREIILLWLRHFRIRIEIRVAAVSSTPSTLSTSSMPSHVSCLSHSSPHSHIPKKDLDPSCHFMDRIDQMADQSEPATERIFHETKFVFLSCAHVTSASVVHTTVDVSLQEAWTHAPTGTKRETTHIVRCETEIVRVQKA